MDHQICLQECIFLEIWLGKWRTSIASADDVSGATLTNQSLEQSECNAWCDWSANKMQTGRHHSRSKKPLWRQDGHRVTMCKRPKGGRQRVKNPHSVQQKFVFNRLRHPFLYVSAVALTNVCDRITTLTKEEAKCAANSTMLSFLPPCVLR